MIFLDVLDTFWANDRNQLEIVFFLLDKTFKMQATVSFYTFNPKVLENLLEKKREEFQANGYIDLTGYFMLDV